MARPRRADHLTKKAKRENYPARSIYKLEEIDQRLHLLKPGQKVLDLGAAPGSWTLYASKRVGPGGKVVSVDIAPLGIPVPANVLPLSLDMLETGPESLLRASSVERFDLVISDMAPSTSGHRLVDQQRSLRLFLAALETAGAVLRPGGGFVGKIFQSEDMDAARKRIRDLFEEERVIRPRGTRTESTEVYLVGLGRKFEMQCP